MATRMKTQLEEKCIVLQGFFGTSLKFVLTSTPSLVKVLSLEDGKKTPVVKGTTTSTV